MTWHTTRYRVNRILHSYAIIGQFLGQLFKRVLRPGDRQAITWNDDHGVGVGQQEGRVVSRAGFHRTGFFRAGRASRVCAVTEAAKQYVEERTVHRLAHDVRDVRADRTGRAHQGTCDDQNRVVQREADPGRGPAGVAVEHRHHYRHVGTADRDDDQHAEHEGQSEHQRECTEVTGHHKGDAQAQGCQAQDQVQLMLTAELYRCALE